MQSREVSQPGSTTNLVNEEEHIPSPPVATRYGHRCIPDDTHKPQGVTTSQFSLFPWRVKADVVSSPVKSEATVVPSMGLTVNPADYA